MLTEIAAMSQVNGICVPWGCPHADVLFYNLYKTEKPKLLSTCMIHVCSACLCGPVVSMFAL